MVETLIRRNIIRRRFLYSYSQNFWVAEISSYTKGVWREEGMQLTMYAVYAS